MNNLVPFRKAWNNKDEGYGEKEYWFNPAIEIKGLEACKVRKGEGEVACVKIFYPDAPYLILVGTVEEFFTKCRQANVAFCILQDLYKEGVTLEKFIKINESVNGIELNY